MPYNKTRRRARSLNLKTVRIKNRTRRSKSLERNKNIKAEELGSGGFGIVSRPPAKCARYLSNNYNANAFREAYYGNPNYVSKLTEGSSAKHELELAEVIKDKISSWQDYFCLIEFICDAPESKAIERNGDYYGTYAIAPYCGVPLSKIIDNRNPAPLNNFELCNLVQSLQTLISGIIKLHVAGIHHMDIHEDNILYDQETGAMRLIDFGLADDSTHIKNKNAPSIIYTEFHDMEQLVKNVIEPLTEFLLDSRISELNIRNKYPFIDDFYYQLRDFYGSINSTLNPRGQTRMSYADNEEKLNRYLQVVIKFKDLKNIYYFANTGNENNRGKN